jgi:hypothetical protein
LRSGRSLNSHPEKTCRHWLSLPCTTNCTKAPVSAANSHDAVFSHARSRMIALPMRIASPGLISTSRTRPLRLFRRPSTATRSFIGVAPSIPPSCSAISEAVLSCLATCVAFCSASFLRASSRLQADNASTGNSMMDKRWRSLGTRIMAPMPDNRPSRVRVIRSHPAHQQVDMLHSCLSNSGWAHQSR